jgi:hypothetical protein
LRGVFRTKRESFLSSYSFKNVEEDSCFLDPASAAIPSARSGCHSDRLDFFISLSVPIPSKLDILLSPYIDYYCTPA